MSTYTPDYRLTIDGSTLPMALRGSVARVSHTDGIVGSDRVEITIANPDLRWLDHPLLQIDKGLTLALGYTPGPLDQVFVGEITGVSPSFPAGGMPTITVVAQDFLHKLSEGTRYREFSIDIPTISKLPIPDPLVADLVSLTNLLIPEIDPAGAAISFLAMMVAFAIDSAEAKKAIPLQEGTSDFDFLSNLSRENGWEMSIDHTAEPRGYVLHFRSLFSDFTPSVALTWGKSLIEFSPRVSKVGQVDKVLTKQWISSLRTELTIALGWDFDRGAFDLQIYPGIKALGDVIEKAMGTVKKLPPTGAAKVPKMLLGELLPRLNSRLTGTGSAVGDTRLKAGVVVNLEGLGEQFGGLYRITSATNTIDGSGFKTSFEARKEVWFGGLALPKGPGGLARVQGRSVG
jgi:phage protein D